MRKILIAALVLAATPALSAAPMVGRDYSEVRKHFIAEGWQPIESPECEPLWVCSDFPEAVGCNTSGKMYCIFEWMRGDKRVRLTTEGEEPITVIGIEE